MIVEKLIDTPPYKILRPSQDNIEEIIEYQQIFDLKQKFQFPRICYRIRANKQRIKREEQISQPTPLKNTIQKVRQTLCDKIKDQWIILEESIEKFNKIDKIEKLKSKPGRPKKSKITNAKISNNDQSAKLMMDFLSK